MINVWCLTGRTTASIYLFFSQHKVNINGLQQIDESNTLDSLGIRINPQINDYLL